MTNQKCITCERGCFSLNPDYQPEDCSRQDENEDDYNERMAEKEYIKKLEKLKEEENLVEAETRGLI